MDHGVKDTGRLSHAGRADGNADAYTARPRQAADARHAVAAFLSGLQPPASSETTQNVLLVVSELVTNALRYAGEVTALRLTAEGDALRVAVEDPSPDQPRERSPDLTGSTGGFGLSMVRSLARTVTVRPHPHGGKSVIAVLAR
ncbi:ATP-binding protein [Streptomyces sp. NPDC048248]|uniref:ATP-binding protein n=1 Tax=Streptomyces sp. NPDC048248 TaxID=3365523 RepID=UPI003724B161